jgi:hypothetical protein
MNGIIQSEVDADENLIMLFNYLDEHNDLTLYKNIYETLQILHNSSINSNSSYYELFLSLLMMLAPSLSNREDSYFPSLDAVKQFYQSSEPLKEILRLLASKFTLQIIFLLYEFEKINFQHLSLFNFDSSNNRLLILVRYLREEGHDNLQFYLHAIYNNLVILLQTNDTKAKFKHFLLVHL